MQSKWFYLKDKSISLRRYGKSVRDIEKILGVPRSTLSLWLRGIVISKTCQRRLEKSWRRGLVLARQKAVLWHNQQKEQRLLCAEREADITLSKIDIEDKSIIEIALALLYFGEGFKKSNHTGIGNSDPLVLNFFISAMREAYDFDVSSIRCELHLRFDQDAYKMKKFWSKELDIPLSNFTSVSFDKRTEGSKTISTYKGVCVLQCGHIAIQRRLVYLSRKFCNKIVELRA